MEKDSGGTPAGSKGFLTEVTSRVRPEGKKGRGFWGRGWRRIQADSKGCSEKWDGKREAGAIRDMAFSPKAMWDKLQVEFYEVHTAFLWNSRLEKDKSLWGERGGRGTGKGVAAAELNWDGAVWTEVGSATVRSQGRGGQVKQPGGMGRSPSRGLSSCLAPSFYISFNL